MSWTDPCKGGCGKHKSDCECNTTNIMKEINLEEIFKIGAWNIRNRIEKTASYSIKEVPYEGTSVNSNELISSIHQLMEDIFKEKI